MSTVTEIRNGIGQSVRRPDGVPKVKGAFAYASDAWADRMLWGSTLRSPHPRAKIRSIEIGAALRVPGVHAVLTHEDVPGRKTYGLEIHDQPVLAWEDVRYQGEAVALVRPHAETARAAARKIEVDYEVLEPRTDGGSSTSRACARSRNGVRPTLRSATARCASARASPTRARSASSATTLPGLAAASRTVGSPQIRNRGTIGGNLGSSSPAGDALPPLYASGAEIELASTRGTRRVPIGEFITGPKRNLLEPDELIAAFHVAPRRARSSSRRSARATRW